MKRPIQKLISFLSAAAMLCNLPMLNAGAAYTVEQIGTEFDSLFRCKDYNMYIESGTGGGTMDASRLIIVDDDGRQRSVTLAKGISGIFPYCSTTIGSYNFLSPSPAAYSFDFFDPAFQIGASEQLLIIEISKGKYALGDMKGKLICDPHDLILYIGEGYYEFADNDGSGGVTVGILSADGTEVIKPSADIERVLMTEDGKNFLIYGKNGDYFTDLQGNRVSDVYPEIFGTESYQYNGKKNFYWSEHGNYERPQFKPGNMQVHDWKNIQSLRLESTLYRFRNDAGQYAVSFGTMKPETDYFNFCSISYDDTTDPETGLPKDKQYIRCAADDYYNTEADCYDLDGNLMDYNPAYEYATSNSNLNSTEDFKKTYTFFSSYTHELQDYYGNALVRMPDECTSAYRYYMNDTVYYVGQADGYFMVLDSEGKVLQDHMEGVAESSIFYRTEEEAKKDKNDETRLVGFFTPEKGIVITPDYEDITYWEYADTNNEGTLIAASKDGKMEFFDITGEKRREFYTDYQFEYENGSWNRPKYDLHCLLLNGTDPNTGKSVSVAYNALEDKILYEIEGTNNRVTDASKDYIVVSGYEGADPSKWTEQDITSQALYRTDGTELIPPTKDLFIDLTKLNPENEDNRLLEYADYETAKKTTDKCFAMLRSRLIKDAGDTYYETTGNIWTSFDGVLVDPENLDTQYATSNSVTAAVKLADQNYAILNNGKWSLAGSGGKQYDMLYYYQDGLAVSANYALEHIEGMMYSSITNKTESVSADLMMIHKGVTDIRGRELVAPFYSGDVTSSGDTIYVRQNSDDDSQSNRYTNFRTQDVFNPITKQYGYDTAIACDDLYVVSKNGLVGVVNADNDEIIPVQYDQALYFTADQYSLASIHAPLSNILSGKQLTSPIRKLGDGTKLISLKTTDGKVEAFRLSLPDTERAVGDVNGDGKINASDATMVLIAATKQGTGNATGLTESQQKAADVNGDGKINAVDATVILRYAAGVGAGRENPIEWYV